VKKLVTGGSHACALLGNGRIQCLGQNGSGQLGNDQGEASETPISVEF
jgi:hypothetical protein